ncbi:MAG: DnaJ domain-containing protein [Cytophagales bacterium]
MKNYLEILELTYGASDADIKKSYRRLVMLYHPDKNKSKDAQTKFIEIQDAYEKLTGPNAVFYKTKPVEPTQPKNEYTSSTYQQTYSQSHTKTSYQESYSQQHQTHSQQHTHSQQYSQTQNQQTNRNQTGGQSKYFFDHLHHLPNVSKWYFKKEDYDAFCLTRITYFALSNLIITLLVKYVLLESLNITDVPYYMCYIAIFDLFLIIDIHLKSINHHAYAVNIIKNITKGFEILMSISNTGIKNFYPNHINSISRYRNSFYIDHEPVELYNYINQFIFHRTPIFSILCEIEGYNKTNHHVKTVFFNHKRQNVKIQSFILLGASLLSCTFHGLGVIDFIIAAYHLVFIRHILINNELD